jgi:RNA polymerase sigma-70 factor (ECF subfamily)
VAKLEAWLRRIVVNEALGILREQKRWNWAELQEIQDQASEWDDQLSELSVAEILQLIASLPPGYRAVFNLAMIEGYSHPEIAQLLNISEGTSKSQLSKARSFLQKKLSNLYRHDYQK